MLIKKNVLILHPADKSACAFYRWLIDKVLKKKDDENRRYKRKRCLAMGAWCQANCMHTVLLIGHKIMPHWEWHIKTNYWYKWRDRWLKLAEKFQGE